MKQMLTQGESVTLRSQGHSLPVPIHHPLNRAALRKTYHEMPARFRRAIFGGWRHTRKQYIGWELA